MIVLDEWYYKLTKLAPNSILSGIIIISAYLYERSFGLLYGTKIPDSTTTGQAKQPQGGIFDIELSYLVMSFLWPILLCVLLFIYKRYAVKYNNSFVSKAIIENKELNIVFHIFVTGALIINFQIYFSQILEEILNGNALQGFFSFIAVFSISYFVCGYLFIKSFSLKYSTL